MHVIKYVYIKKSINKSCMYIVQIYIYICLICYLIGYIFDYLKYLNYFSINYTIFIPYIYVLSNYKLFHIVIINYIF